MAAGTALDTSVVVPALLDWHDHHQAAQRVVNDAIEAGDAILPLPALLEAYAVITRLPQPWRLGPRVARQLLAATFQPRSRIVALEATEGWSLLSGIADLGVAGGTTHDAHILACAKKAGAARLATFNDRHFLRLDLGDLRLLVP